MIDDIKDEFEPPLAGVLRKRKIKSAVNLYNRHRRSREDWLKDNPTVGKWTILREATLRGHRVVMHCRCSCGVEHDVLLASLKTGRSTQCVKCARRKTNAQS